MKKLSIGIEVYVIGVVKISIFIHYACIQIQFASTMGASNSTHFIVPNSVVQIIVKEIGTRVEGEGNDGTSFMNTTIYANYREL